MQSFWIFALAAVSFTKASEEQYRLIDDIFHKKRYNKVIRPVINETTPILITIELYLSQINDVIEKYQTISTMVWLTQRWTDEYLRWDPQDYNNLTAVRLPSNMVWLPDTVLYNTRETSNEQLMSIQTTLIINNDGSVDWSAPITLISQCSVDVNFYPFDAQTCNLKFGSWQHDARLIDYPEAVADASMYQHNGEWDTFKMNFKRNVKIYACCPDKQYPDVTFTLILRRKPLFYVVNLIIPCALISAMSIIEFILPCNSGEKVSLGITVLLSLTVFMLVVAENMPANSDDIPIIARYYIVTIFLVSFSTFMTVIVLNLHHRKYRVPNWVHNIFIGGLAPIFCLKVNSRRTKNIYNSRKHHFQLVPTASTATTYLDQDSYLSKDDTPSVNNTPRHGQTETAYTTSTSQPRRPWDWKEQAIMDTLSNVRFLAQRFAEKDREEDMANEWQSVAKVMDRFFLGAYIICVVVMDIVIGMQIFQDHDLPDEVLKPVE
ncbi:neuronal acetylcholine receptor subunit alpha-10-like [Acanthaster planci]|uniref:Neuronal acetylcholine receptor subunit alpha-10-like n=1 Tax=Acanthaster planci TaxID=133434 RepID=A0A8B7ZPR6_ACAPL|nr:neuronal acetylcholine receptor subunit alpha-10-like [Acanthaster planci]